jgi:hypothetical protein
MHCASITVTASGNPAKVTVICKVDIVQISSSREVIEEVTRKIASLSALRSLVIPSGCLTRLQVWNHPSDYLQLKELVSSAVSGT